MENMPYTASIRRSARECFPCFLREDRRWCMGTGVSPGYRNY